jgi:predicted ester cyclase
MSEESNKQVSRRFTELFGTDEVTLADEVFAPDVVFHGLEGGDLRGVEATKGFIAAYRAAFPDAVSTVEEQVAEGDMVVTRWRARGTHRGPLGDLEPTGRAFDTGGMTMERCVDGRIAEVWVARDELGLLRQLGAIPDRAPAAA